MIPLRQLWTTSHLIKNHAEILSESKNCFHGSIHISALWNRWPLFFFHKCRTVIWIRDIKNRLLCAFIAFFNHCVIRQNKRSKEAWFKHRAWRWRAAFQFSFLIGAHFLIRMYRAAQLHCSNSFDAECCNNCKTVPTVIIPWWRKITLIEYKIKCFVYYQFNIYS